MTNHQSCLRDEAQVAERDGLPVTAKMLDAAADEIDRLQAVAKACIEVDVVRPVMPQIMEAVRRWQEFSAPAAEKSKESQ